MTRSIYVATSDDGAVKIGISSHIVWRMGRLCAEKKQAITLEYCGDCDGPAIEAIEKQAHALLHGHRIKGEWFAVSVADAINAVLLAASQCGYELRARDFEREYSKRGRGRPATGIGRAEGLRLYPELSDAIEKWRSRQAEPISRPEAIRRLLEIALKK